MEAEIIIHFLPKLVTAISDSLLPVSSACLAKGIISETTHSLVLQSGGTTERKTNDFLLAVIKSTKTDSRCFEIFLSVLNDVLPYAVKDAVLLAMRQELLAKCMSVVSCGKSSQVASVTPLTSAEVVNQQTSLVGKLEDAIRQHERACVEKHTLEENMKIMEEENKKLKDELDSLKQNKTTDVSDTAMNEKIASTENRISAYENKMTGLQQRIEDLKSTIEEQSMQIKREVGTGVVNILDHVSVIVQQESEKKEAILKQKEEDLLAAQKEKEHRSLEALKEKDAQLKLLQTREDELHRRILKLENALQEKEKALLMSQEEGKEMEQRSSEILKEKDVQLQLCENALQEKEKVLLAAQEEGKEKEQHSLEMLKEKDTKLQVLQKKEHELHRRIQQLEHKNALQEKEMRIKKLELQNLMSRQKEESTIEERKPTLKTKDLDSGASKQKRGLFDWFRPRRDNVQLLSEVQRPSHDGTYECRDGANECGNNESLCRDGANECGNNQCRDGANECGDNQCRDGANECDNDQYDGTNECRDGANECGDNQCCDAMEDGRHHSIQDYSYWSLEQD